MLPVLFSLGPIKAYSYGVCLAIGFLLAVYLIWKKATEANFDEEELFDVIFLVTLAGLLGSRIYYIFLHFGDFRFNVLKWFLLIRYPGLAFHGALILGFPALYWVTKKRKWPFWPVADMAVLGLVVGQVLGRVGCFLNGCCYGRVTDSFLGVYFPGSFERRHPTQLYEAVGLVIIFFILNHVYQRYRFFTWYKGKNDEAEPGLTSSLYFGFYGLLRFFIEFFRGDSVYWKGIRSAQILSMLMIIGGVILGYQRSGREWREDIKRGGGVVKKGLSRLRFNVKRQARTFKKMRRKYGKD